MRAARTIVLCMFTVAALLALALGTSLAASSSTPYSVEKVESPAPQLKGRWAERAVAAGDLNGDKTPDFFVADPMQDVNGIADTGRVYAMNGRNRAVLYTIDSPSPQTNSKFGFYISVVGDENGDHVNDIAIGTDAQDVYTGTGAPCGAPEPNGCNEDQGEAWLFSGKDGSVLLRIDDPEPQAGATFGFQDAAPLTPGDVNGDRRADLYANGFVQNGPAGEGQGKAWVFSGSDGHLLYELKDPTPEVGGQFGWSVSPAFFNKDRVPDLYVGQSPHHVAGATGSGGTYVFDGRNGSLLKAFELPESDRQTSSAGNLGPNLGWANASPGDLNRDGQPDFVAGAPFEDVGANQDQGRLLVFLSHDVTAPTKPRVRVRRGVAHFTASDPDNRSDQLRFRCSTTPRLHACSATVRVRRGSVLRVQAADPAGNRSPVARVRIH